MKKIHKIVFALLCIIAVVACTEEFTDNGKYTYLPQSITTNDTLSVNYVSKYVYDNQNRPTAFIDITIALSKTDSVSSQIIYDDNGNISEVISRYFGLSATEPDSILTTNFSYTASNILMSKTYTNQAKEEAVIEVNEKKQMIKYTIADKTESFEYDLNGNLERYIDPKEAKFEYAYDKKRGIFKHVNVPQWFINAVLAPDRHSSARDLGKNRNITNNCTFVYNFIPATDETPEIRTAQTLIYYTYNTFGYPLTISNNHNFTSTVTYTRTQ